VNAVAARVRCGSYSVYRCDKVLRGTSRFDATSHVAAVAYAEQVLSWLREAVRRPEWRHVHFIVSRVHQINEAS